MRFLNASKRNDAKHEHKQVDAGGVVQLHRTEISLLNFDVRRQLRHLADAEIINLPDQTTVAILNVEAATKTKRSSIDANRSQPTYPQAAVLSVKSYNFVSWCAVHKLVVLPIT